tara:strand:+ start:496 stop:795 length:300 start_codon:yes stop_codon:yes gene_type:complete
MATFDNVVSTLANFKGYTGNPPTTEAEYKDFDCWEDASSAPLWESVSAGMALEEVRAKRQTAYDSIGNQLDMMMKDKRDGTTTHQTACEAVKAQFPKPE